MSVYQIQPDPHSTIPPRWGANSVPSRTDLARALLCPFPARLNSSVEGAHLHCGRWLQRFYRDAELTGRAAAARMAWMVAGFYPTCGKPELFLSADYLCWAFSLDDVGDETQLGQQPARLAELFAEFDEVFAGASPQPTAEASVVALHDIVQRLSSLASAEHFRAFQLGNQAYFGAMLWEANNRAGRWVPQESSFLSMRPAAGAVPPFFALIEPLEGIQLSLRAKTDPQLQELQRLAGGIVCWINDVLSYDKEQGRGDLHNLALVYEKHRGLSSGQALFEAVKLCNAETHGFLERAAAMPSFSETEDRERDRYVDTLRSMIRTTKDWTLNSSRYALSEAPTEALMGA